MKIRDLLDKEVYVVTISTGYEDFEVYGVYATKEKVLSDIDAYDVSLEVAEDKVDYYKKWGEDVVMTVEIKEIK